MRKLATLIALVALTSVASAAMTGDFNKNTTGSTAISGLIAGDWVVNDLVVNTTLDWTSCEITITPDANGLIYQDAMGGNAPPLEAWVGMVASLEWDTYASGGGFSTSSSTGIAPAFTDDSNTPLDNIFTADKISLVTYYTSTTNDIGTIGLFRTTLDDSAGGSWTCNVYDAGSATIPARMLGGDIVDGVMLPEPATMLMLIGGGLGVFMRRRRK